MLLLHTEADAGKARHPESAATWTGVPERYIAIEPASKQRRQPMASMKDFLRRKILTRSHHAVYRCGLVSLLEARTLMSAFFVRRSSSGWSAVGPISAIALLVLVWVSVPVG